MEFISYNELEYKTDGIFLRDNISDKKYENQDLIEKYLSNCEIFSASSGYEKDVFTGERIPVQKLILADGKYLWPKCPSYYVNKYNLRLSKEFKKYILSKVS